MAQTSVSPWSSPGDSAQQHSGLGLERAEKTRPSLPKKDRRHRIGINEDVYLLLKAAAQREGRPMSQVTADAIVAYVNAMS